LAWQVPLTGQVFPLQHRNWLAPQQNPDWHWKAPPPQSAAEVHADRHAAASPSELSR
jgi:hypothetical protein